MAEHTFVSNWRKNWKFHTGLIVLTWLFCIFSSCSAFLSYYFKTANQVFSERITHLEAISGENLATEQDTYAANTKAITQHFDQMQLLLLILILLITGGMIIYFCKKNRKNATGKMLADGTTPSGLGYNLITFMAPLFISLLVAVALVFLFQDFFITQLQHLGADMIAGVPTDNSLVAKALQGATQSSADFLSQYSTKNFFHFNLKLSNANFEFVFIESFLKNVITVLVWLTAAFTFLFTLFHRSDLAHKKAQLTKLNHQ